MTLFLGINLQYVDVQLAVVEASKGVFEKGQLTLGLYCMAGSESAVSVRAWSRQSPRRHATNVPTSVYLFLAVCESSPTLPLLSCMFGCHGYGQAGTVRPGAWASMHRDRLEPRRRAAIMSWMRCDYTDTRGLQTPRIHHAIRRPGAMPADRPRGVLNSPVRTAGSSGG